MDQPYFSLTIRLEHGDFYLGVERAAAHAPPVPAQTRAQPMPDLDLERWHVDLDLAARNDGSLDFDTYWYCPLCSARNFDMDRLHCRLCVPDDDSKQPGADDGPMLLGDGANNNPCRDCNGRGHKVRFNKSRPCKRCKGTGASPKTDVQRKLLDAVSALEAHDLARGM